MCEDIVASKNITLGEVVEIYNSLKLSSHDIALHTRAINEFIFGNFSKRDDLIRLFNEAKDLKTTFDDVKLCSNEVCKAEVKKYDKFCSSCGTPLKEPDTENEH